MQRVTDIGTKVKSQNVQNAQEIRKITEKKNICTKLNSVRKKQKCYSVTEVYSLVYKLCIYLNF